ncbi:MAG: hypothetical protein COB36_01120 [Alphaproteobacteria bacterium]|nr:MAG: hypothetical protein COB36_01120 [Alphaproteobacteria bacterium]
MRTDENKTIFGNLSLFQRGLDRQFNAPANPDIRDAIATRTLELLDNNPNKPITPATLKQLISDLSETYKQQAGVNEARTRTADTAFSGVTQIYVDNVDGNAFKNLPEPRAFAL